MLCCDRQGLSKFQNNIHSYMILKQCILKCYFYIMISKSSIISFQVNQCNNLEYFHHHIVEVFMLYRDKNIFFRIEKIMRDI